MTSKHNFKETLPHFWVKLLVFLRFGIWNTSKFWHITTDRWRLPTGKSIYLPIPENSKDIKIIDAWEYENKLNGRYNLGNYL